MPARILTGVVVSDKSSKTVVVQVDRSKRHPLYSKAYTVSKKFAAHDENDEAHAGDKVQIQECPPISKSKSWKLLKIVEKAESAPLPTEEPTEEKV